MIGAPEIISFDSPKDQGNKLGREYLRPRKQSKKYCICIQFCDFFAKGESSTTCKTYQIKGLQNLRGYSILSLKNMRKGIFTLPFFVCLQVYYQYLGHLPIVPVNMEWWRTHDHGRYVKKYLFIYNDRFHHVKPLYQYLTVSVDVNVKVQHTLQFTPLVFSAANVIHNFSSFHSTKYPSLLGGQRQYGMRSLPNTSTHDST